MPAADQVHRDLVSHGYVLVACYAERGRGHGNVREHAILPFAGGVCRAWGRDKGWTCELMGKLCHEVVCIRLLSVAIRVFALGGGSSRRQGAGTGPIDGRVMVVIVGDCGLLHCHAQRTFASSFFV